MGNKSHNYAPNAHTGKQFCTFPACVQARKSRQWTTSLFWLASLSWFLSITMAVWINMREPTLQALRVENIRLQSQLLYLQGRMTIEGVIDEIAKSQKDAGSSAVVYALPARANQSRK